MAESKSVKRHVHTRKYDYIVLFMVVFYSYIGWFVLIRSDNYAICSLELHKYFWGMSISWVLISMVGILVIIFTNVFRPRKHHMKTCLYWLLFFQGSFDVSLSSGIITADSCHQSLPVIFRAIWYGPQNQLMMFLSNKIVVLFGICYFVMVPGFKLWCINVNKTKCQDNTQDKDEPIISQPFV
jgi:hypothetical protein